jgi:hypothetical protein
MPRKIAAGCVVRATFDGEVRYLLIRAGVTIAAGPIRFPKACPARRAPEKRCANSRNRARLPHPEPLSRSTTSSRKTVIAYLAEPLAAIAARLPDWESIARVHRRRAHPKPSGPAAVARPRAGEGRRPVTGDEPRAALT